MFADGPTTSTSERTGYVGPRLERGFHDHMPEKNETEGEPS